MFGKLRWIILFLFLSANLSAQPSWEFPTKNIPDLSGGFADLRNNHFHTGIDIRTGGKIGIPIYSISNGWIYRIRVSPWGFGNTLYIYHPTGNISVYAHLNSFISSISDSIFNRQQLEKKGPVDWYLSPNSFPIYKGQLIAYSGNTGQSGGPHLHFEIRSEESQIINPLNYYAKLFKDTIRPQPLGVRFIPLGVGAEINGKDKALFKKPIGKAGQYYISDTLSITGNIGIEIEAIDKIKFQGFSFNIPYIELFLDDTLIYCSRIDSFNFDQKREINAHIDYSEFQLTQHKWQKCFAQPGITLNSCASPFYSGRIQINDHQVHIYKIKLEDKFGNKSEIKGYLKKAISVKEYIFQPNSDLPFASTTIRRNLLQLRVSPASAELANHWEMKTTQNSILKLGPPNRIISNEMIWDINIHDSIIPKIFQHSSGIKSNPLSIVKIINPQEHTYWKQGNISLNIPPKSLADTFALEIKEIPTILNTIGASWKIGNTEEPLIRPITLSMRTPIINLDSNQCYISKVNATSNFKKKEGTYFAKDSFFISLQEWGSYALVCDTLSPEIKFINYKPGIRISSKVPVRIKVSDRDAGLADEKTQVMAGDKWIPVILDARTEEYKIPYSALPKGKYSLIIQVWDKAGNSATANYSILN